MALSELFCGRSRRAEVCEEIVDMLHSFSDFLAFKQMFLDYKAVRPVCVCVCVRVVCVCVCVCV